MDDSFDYCFYNHLTFNDVGVLLNFIKVNINHPLIFVSIVDLFRHLMTPLMRIPLGIRPSFVFTEPPFKTLLVAGGLFAGISSQAQILITKWDFNAANLQPSIGSGTISLIGGTTATFAGGFDDENVGWRTANYPAQGQNNLTAGIQMQVSTIGKTGITLSYSVRHGIEAANRQSILWSTDNSTYQPAQVFTFAPQASGTGDTWYNRTVSLPSGANNQPNLYIRIVSNFTPGLSAYTASQLGTTYSGSGPWRFDDVTFSAVPEPATSAAFAATALIGFALLRKRWRGSSQAGPSVRNGD